MRRSRRRLRSRRCARMRRFRNWRSGTGCIRTRSMPGRSRFSTMSRACSREERERETAKLYAKIGQLTVERDFLVSAPDRRAMVERPGKDLSVRRRCALVGVARSGVYRPKPVAGADDLAVMRRIDELHLELPFYGSRRMT